MPTLCPTCGLSAPDGARFCESDGTLLAPLASPEPATLPPPKTTIRCRCGAGPEAEEDGYCDACGRPWPVVRASQPRDHAEIAVSHRLGGVTDRGQKHPNNEDDFALSADESGAGAVVLVVCDGVSSSTDAQSASAIAARTTCDLLAAAACPGDAEALAAVGEAIAAANRAVCALPSSLTRGDREPPESTIVAALVGPRSVALGWLGDSRAYWIPDADPSGARLLTHDHSWFNDVVDSGEMTEAEAQRNRLAHAITRCLGESDDPGSVEPTLITFALPETSGMLLLCSDGLWNYAPETAQIAALVQEAPRDEGMVGIARSLVAWANAQGGRDNITVALWESAGVPHVVALAETLPPN